MCNELTNLRVEALLIERGLVRRSLSGVSGRNTARWEQAPPEPELAPVTTGAFLLCLLGVLFLL